ncbi:hypothetical protein M9Y10_033953 [Tritrichomonas musculus]|uniref:Uncharacterized protein n=1 Tax=Tritrichomonas musculus TaxID=1915356 RepID=A0ABR2KDJ7_9EUKA
MPVGTKTRSKLTHNGPTISQIEKGFVNAVVEFKVKFQNDIEEDELIRESFAYNSIKASDAKAANPHVHSIWEKVMNFIPCECGVYIPLSKFERGQSVDVKFTD